jgi:DNA (cytosine-5)-methyltransferase 1
VITVREAARLHSFADSMQFPKSTSTAHMAIGNAVPPLLAYRLAEISRNALYGTNTQTGDAATRAI